MFDNMYNNSQEFPEKWKNVTFGYRALFLGDHKKKCGMFDKVTSSQSYNNVS